MRKKKKKTKYILYMFLTREVRKEDAFLNFFCKDFLIVISSMYYVKHCIKHYCACDCRHKVILLTLLKKNCTTLRRRDYRYESSMAI